MVGQLEAGLAGCARVWLVKAWPGVVSGPFVSCQTSAGPNEHATKKAFAGPIADLRKRVFIFCKLRPCLRPGRINKGYASFSGSVALSLWHCTHNSQPTHPLKDQSHSQSPFGGGQYVLSFSKNSTPVPAYLPAPPSHS